MTAVIQRLLGHTGIRSTAPDVHLVNDTLQINPVTVFSRNKRLGGRP